MNICEGQSQNPKSMDHSPCQEIPWQGLVADG